MDSVTLEYAISHMPMLKVVEILRTMIETRSITDGEWSDALISAINALVSAARLLPERLNDRSLVHRLPAEILRNVLEDALLPGRAPSDDARTWPQGRVRGNSGLLSLTHVCRRWRHVALSDPVLWSNFHACNKPAAEWFQQALLERSQTASLNIHIDTQPTPIFADLICDEFSRIRTIDVLEEFSDYFAWYLTEASHNVENMTIRGDKWQKLGEPLITTRDTNFFARPTPRLLRLALLGVGFLPLRHSVSNLTHLAIEPRRAPNWTASDLASLLQGNPLLREVFLARLDFAPTDSENIQQIRLPRLRRLNLENLRPVLAEWLLQHLRRPNGCAVLVSDLVDRRGQWDMSNIHPVRYIDRLHLQDEFELSTRTTITATDSQSLSAVRFQGTTTPWLFVPDDEWLATSGFSSHIWAPWPLEQLRELWVTLSEAGSFLRLDRFTGLTTLLSTGTMSSLTVLVIRAMQECRDEDKTDGGVVELLEALVFQATPPTLVELRLWIRSAHRGPYSEPVAIPAAELSWMVRKFKHTGRQLCKLVIEGCQRTLAGDVRDWLDIASHVDSLEIRLWMECYPEMPLPEVCNYDTHDFWPAWT